MKTMSRFLPQINHIQWKKGDKKPSLLTELAVTNVDCKAYSVQIRCDHSSQQVLAHPLTNLMFLGCNQKHSITSPQLQLYYLCFKGVGREGGGVIAVPPTTELQPVIKAASSTIKIYHLWLCRQKYKLFSPFLQ